VKLRGLIGPLLLALALGGACGKDKTTALDIELANLMGMVDQIRIEAVTLDGAPVSLTDEQKLFPGSMRPLKNGDVLTIWFADSSDRQTAAVTATGLLCGKDATEPTMTASKILAKGQTVRTTLELTSTATVCNGGGGRGGMGGAAGSAGSGGAAGGAGGSAGGAGGSAGGAGGSAGGTGGSASGGVVSLRRLTMMRGPPSSSATASARATPVAVRTAASCGTRVGLRAIARSQFDLTLLRIFDKLPSQIGRH